MNIKQAYAAIEAALPEPWAITCDLWSKGYSGNNWWSVWSGERELHYRSKTLAGAVAAAIEAHQTHEVGQRFEPSPPDKVGAELEGLEEVGKDNQ